MMGHLAKLLSPSLEAMGYETVRVTLMGGDRKILQVMAERVDGGPMTVADCEEVSKTLSAILDVEDPIPGSYSLEVSSPGLDRPLTRRKDYVRFAGHEARMELDRLVDGRRRIKGVLKGMNADEDVLILPAGEPEDAQPVAVPFGTILKAKLILTDALIADALKRGADQGMDPGVGPVEGSEASSA
ncbi:MAG: ribosome maturation factor RimP [Rhodospirillaceae bacterium]